MKSPKRIATGKASARKCPGKKTARKSPSKKTTKKGETALTLTPLVSLTLVCARVTEVVVCV